MRQIWSRVSELLGCHKLLVVVNTKTKTHCLDYCLILTRQVTSPYMANGGVI